MSVNGLDQIGRGVPPLVEKSVSTVEGSVLKSVAEKTVTGEKKISKVELEKEIEALNKLMQSNQQTTHLRFTMHEELGEYYVQIVNDQSDEVVREIPSKKILDMVAKIFEMVGLLVDEKR